jgi:uncharacterized protein
MLCPVCDNVQMKEVERDNVLIDICPSCKGVWLDRGELEKITKGLHEDQQYFTSGFSEPNKEQYPPHQHYTPGYPPNEPGFDPKYGHQPKYKTYPKHDKYYDYKYDKYPKYDKYGNPYPYKYKKKKTMFDIFDDLF